MKWEQTHAVPSGEHWAPYKLKKPHRSSINVDLVKLEHL